LGPKAARTRFSKSNARSPTPPAGKSTLIYPNENNGSFIFKTTNAGWSWNEIGNDIAQATHHPPVSLTVDPVTPSTLYVVSVYGDISKSMDGGATWNVIKARPVLTRIHGPEISLIWSPGFRALAIALERATKSEARPDIHEIWIVASLWNIPPSVSQSSLSRACLRRVNRAAIWILRSCSVYFYGASEPR
jgi:hypothetical protein